MTAFETQQFTGQQLNALNAIKQQIKLGTLKEKDLPAEFKERLSPEYAANMVEANKRANAKCMEELKEWYGK